MLNRTVPAAGEAMPAVTISPTIASVIAAHSAAQSANGEAHTAHETRPDDIAEAVAAALFDAAEACHNAERAAWGAFLDASCLSPIDVQAKLAHAFGKDGSFDEDAEHARLTRSLVLPSTPPAKPTVEATADPETAIYNARMFGALLNWLVCEMLGGALNDDGMADVSQSERDLLAFASGQAADAAQKADEVYSAWRFGR